MNFLLKSYLPASVACLVLLLVHIDALSVGHSHHNKRQQSSMNAPMLTLDVEPHAGIQPSHSQTQAVPDYYFPVDAGLFNFTCTIKHPNYFKMIITRERVLNSTNTFLPIFKWKPFWVPSLKILKLVMPPKKKLVLF